MQLGQGRIWGLHRSWCIFETEVEVWISNSLLKV
jgi:hypothetical protein